MKIVVIGATGTIGKAVVENLQDRHEVIKVGKSGGDYQVDIADETSIRTLFETIGEFDALVSATGDLAFAPLTEMTSEQWDMGLRSKLMGQINLVRHGLKYVRDRGSFTLTSGILSIDPILWGAAATTVNGALERFAVAAAIEAPRGVRINVVSPTVLTESWDKYGSFFPGETPVDAAKVAKAFQKSIEGAQTGKVIYLRG
ncbi:short-chain alcohol dehydrogenase-like protein [Hahella chejuensis KCTC 2396]|uniref:Short-chain alcohol dehydrogenase-like protein n=1 Tax=Hahella chejuensis (strain KCTC 2396) TaxID=349521 RepID=Q2SAA9_HAHCH|nr:short chain dehydrogenase [Hahella chejuensis]ABC32415.1 short-chain alcohol dehydrogenase-like protein [Hahella chejuensis KCTC 2396]